MSAKGFWVSQDGHLAAVIAPKSSGAAVAGQRFSLAQYNHASVILQFGAAGGPVGAITASVYAAQTGGTGVPISTRLVKFENAATPFDVATLNTATNNTLFAEPVAGYTPASDLNDAMYILEIEATDVLAAANGTYIEVDIAVGSMGTTPQLLSACAILSGGRVTGDNTASAQV
jgi:hypothetical protein